MQKVTIKRILLVYLDKAILLGTIGQDIETGSSIELDIKMHLSTPPPQKKGSI